MFLIMIDLIYMPDKSLLAEMSNFFWGMIPFQILDEMEDTILYNYINSTLLTLY